MHKTDLLHIIKEIALTEKRIRDIQLEESRAFKELNRLVTILLEIGGNTEISFIENRAGLSEADSK